MEPDDSNTDAGVVSLPAEYPKLLEEIKARVHASRIRAAVSVNRELVLLYWGIGRLILQRLRAGAPR